MKYNQFCPKCQSREIAIIEGGGFKGNTYNSISFGLNMIYLTRYVCTQCGYCENYVGNPKDIKKIRDKYNFPNMDITNDGFV